jgi:ABC-type uncharacterized transport system auxiliary subunit
MKTYRSLAILITALLLGGCIGTSAPAPSDNYYRIPLIKPVDAPAQPLLQGVTAVERLQAAGLYQERAIVYVEANKPLQLHHYHYHHWLENPSRLLQDIMLGWMQQARFSAHVVRYRAMSGIDRVIHGRIRRFERVLGRHISVVVELELGIHNGKRKVLLWPRTYRAEVRAKDNRIHATAQAFGQAISQIMSRFVRDAQAIAH